jgi:hypothetical protein
LEIDNRKRNCPDCKTKLPTIASTNLNQSVYQPAESINSNRETVFKTFAVEKTSKDPQNSKISVTQRSIADQGVQIPGFYVPDPIPVNPNSLKNVEKILKHIENIAGITSGKRKWLPVVCDGVPYNLTLKLRKSFPWLIILPGPLHEEMNMLKAFVKLNWYDFFF